MRQQGRAVLLEAIGQKQRETAWRQQAPDPMHHPLGHGQGAGIPKLKRRFHALRHAIAVHLLDAGADVAFVQDRLGHANIPNTMVYMRYTTITRDAQTRQLFASHKIV
jgi:integrase